MNQKHFELPMAPEQQQQEMRQLELKTRMERIGRKILVLSGKGGVGKSTLATNLAMALARAGRKVGLLDVDLHGPSIPTLLGLNGQRLGADATGGISPIQINGNLCAVSVGLLLDSARDAVIWRGPMKHEVIRQLLTDVAWGRLDDLIIDSPPGTGDEPLSVAQLAGPKADAIIVTTPQDVAVADVRRSLSFCETLKINVLGIIENMSGMACPHCGETIDLFKRGGGKRLAEEAGVPFLGRIPLDPEVVLTGDRGATVVDLEEASPASEALANVLAPLLEGATPRANHHHLNSEEDSPTMKIAIPTANGQLCMHFGHCEQFALVEVDSARKAIRKVTFETPPPHEPGVLPRWLHEMGATTIIAGGMGQRAQSLFAENGIDVVVGATGGTPEALASAYLENSLQTGENLCDH